VGTSSLAVATVVACGSSNSSTPVVMSDAGPKGSSSSGADSAAGGGGEGGEGSGEGGSDGGSPVTGCSALTDCAAAMVTLTGSVTKGPFAKGSAVQVAAPPDAPAETLFPTTTSDALGSFRLELSYQGPAVLSGSGTYFNELTNAASTQPVTLKSLIDVTADPMQTAHANVFTHLAYNRAKSLLSSEPFATAVAQAEKELRGQLAIGGPSFDPGVGGAQLDLFGGDNDASAYEFAVGAVFLQVAQFGNGTLYGDAYLQTLLDTTAATFESSDAGSGTLPMTTTSGIQRAQRCLEPDVAIANLQGYLTQAGTLQPVPNINRALDSDLDGVPNFIDTCPLTPNPSQATLVDAVCNFKRGVTSAPPQSSGTSGLWVSNAASASADIDGKNGIDIVAFGGNRLGTWLNDGTGSFQGAPVITSGTSLGTGNGPSQAPSLYAMALGDLTGDGKIDVVVVLQPTSGPLSVGYFAGDGTGAFGAFTQIFTLPAITASGPQSGRLVLADMNGDKRLDVVTVYGVALAPTSGAWSAPTPFVFPKPTSATGNPPTVVGFDVADMNEDKSLDVILAATANGDATVTYGGVATLINAGNATFSTSTTYGSTFGANAWTVSAGDVDGDHHEDIVAFVGPTSQYGFPGTMTVGFGAGNGTLVASTTVSGNALNTCSGSTASASYMTTFVADMTGDGKADVLNLLEGTVTPSQGRTMGTPVWAVYHPGLSGAFWGSVADLNGDGISDLVVGQWHSGIGYVLFDVAGYHSW
jgi:hypothetical protein